MLIIFWIACHNFHSLEYWHLFLTFFLYRSIDMNWGHSLVTSICWGICREFLETKGLVGFNGMSHCFRTSHLFPLFTDKIQFWPWADAYSGIGGLRSNLPPTPRPKVYSIYKNFSGENPKKPPLKFLRLYKKGQSPPLQRGNKDLYRPGKNV